MKLFIFYMLLVVASAKQVPQRNITKENENSINQTNAAVITLQDTFYQAMSFIPAYTCLPSSAMNLLPCAREQDRIRCAMNMLDAWNQTAFENGTKIISLDAVQQNLIASSNLTKDQQKSANASFYTCASSDPIFNDRTNGLVTTASPLERAKIRFMARLASTTTRSSTTKNSSNGRRKKRQGTNSLVNSTTTQTGVTKSSSGAMVKTYPTTNTTNPRIEDNKTGNSTKDWKRNETIKDDSQQRLINATRLHIVLKQANVAFTCVLKAIGENGCVVGVGNQSQDSSDSDSPVNIEKELAEFPCYSSAYAATMRKCFVNYNGSNANASANALCVVRDIGALKNGTADPKVVAKKVVDDSSISVSQKTSANTTFYECLKTSDGPNSPFVSLSNQETLLSCGNHALGLNGCNPSAPNMTSNSNTNIWHQDIKQT